MQVRRRLDDLGRAMSQSWLLLSCYLTLPSRAERDDLLWSARTVVEKVKTDQRSRALELLCLGFFGRGSHLYPLVTAEDLYVPDKRFTLKSGFETNFGVDAWKPKPTNARMIWQRSRMVYPFLEVAHRAWLNMTDMALGQSEPEDCNIIYADEEEDEEMPEAYADYEALCGDEADYENSAAIGELLDRIARASPEEKVLNSLLYWMIDLTYKVRRLLASLASPPPPNHLTSISLHLPSPNHTPLHLPCISPPPPLHLPSISPASPFHLPCISLPSPLHPSISPTGHARGRRHQAVGPRALHPPPPRGRSPHGRRGRSDGPPAAAALPIGKGRVHPWGQVRFKATPAHPPMLTHPLAPLLTHRLAPLLTHPLPCAGTTPCHPPGLTPSRRLLLQVKEVETTTTLLSSIRSSCAESCPLVLQEYDELMLSEVTSNVVEPAARKGIALSHCPLS